ncbi:MAG: VOC family protein [Gammaproteobacteria bacterium]|nr:VOC family protein [Gammaproteobacteria bacterium]
MIDHFEIKTVEFESCVNFYAVVLRPLDIELKWSDDTAAGFGVKGDEKVQFLIEKSDTREPCHIAFSAQSQSSVDQFHTAGLENGFTNNGEPGVRAEYAANYYAAFLHDPDGNNIEAVTYI